MLLLSITAQDVSHLILHMCRDGCVLSRQFISSYIATYISTYLWQCNKISQHSFQVIYGSLASSLCNLIIRLHPKVLKTNLNFMLHFEVPLKGPSVCTILTGVRACMHPCTHPSSNSVFFGNWYSVKHLLLAVCSTPTRVNPCCLAVIRYPDKSAARTCNDKKYSLIIHTGANAQLAFTQHAQCGLAVVVVLMPLTTKTTPCCRLSYTEIKPPVLPP